MSFLCHPPPCFPPSLLHLSLLLYIHLFLPFGSSTQFPLHFLRAVALASGSFRCPHRDQTEVAVTRGGGAGPGSTLKQRPSEEEEGLTRSASSSCLPLLYHTQCDAGMSGMFFLFDYLSLSPSIKGRRGKRPHYPNHLSLKTSFGSKGGESLAGD